MINAQQSAYNDAQGDPGTWLLQAAAAASAEFAIVVASARFMLAHPIDDLDEAVLQDRIDGSLPAVKHFPRPSSFAIPSLTG